MNTAVNNIADCKNSVNVKYEKCKNNCRNGSESNNCATESDIGPLHAELQRLPNSEQITVSTSQQNEPLHQRADFVQHTDKRGHKLSNVQHQQHQQHSHRHDHNHHHQCAQQQQHQQQLHHQLLHDHQQKCATTKRCVERAQQQCEQHKQPEIANASDKRQQHFNQQHPQRDGRRQLQQQQQQQQKQRRLRLWASPCIATSRSNSINCSSNHTPNTSKFNSTETSLHTHNAAALSTTTSFPSTSSSHATPSTRGCASSATAKVSVAVTAATVAAQGSRRTTYIFKAVTSASQAATTYYLWWLFGVCLVLFTNGGRDWRSAELTRTTFMVAATYLEPDELIHELDRPGESSSIGVGTHIS